MLVTYSARFAYDKLHVPDLDRNRKYPHIRRNQADTLNHASIVRKQSGMQLSDFHKHDQYGHDSAADERQRRQRPPLFVFAEAPPEYKACCRNNSGMSSIFLDFFKKIFERVGFSARTICGTIYLVILIFCCYMYILSILGIYTYHLTEVTVKLYETLQIIRNVLH